MSDVTSDKLTVTVVVASVAGERGLRACLRSLAVQAPPHEVIVATVDDVELLELRKDFPNARFVCGPAESTVFQLRSIGVKQAQSEIVVLTEGHCTFAPGWLSGLIDA